MLKICLVFCKSEPQYAYKRYMPIQKHVVNSVSMLFLNQVQYQQNEATMILEQVEKEDVRVRALQKQIKVSTSKV